MAENNAKRVIVRVTGGIGNQFFAYAAAMRLAMVNNAELVVDHKTGYYRDLIFRNEYSLDHFCISARHARGKELLEPFERFHRLILRLRAKYQEFSQRKYIQQELPDFDPRLLDLRFSHSVILDGYWLNTGYFADIEPVIRREFRLAKQPDADNLAFADRIDGANSVAIHIRRFDQAGGLKDQNVPFEYYKKAIAVIHERIENPHFFIFSDDAPAALKSLSPLAKNLSVVDINQKKSLAHLDLFLMRKCRHFIIANSTFSWLGAWLSENPVKIVIAPDFIPPGSNGGGFLDLIPADWTKLKF